MSIRNDIITEILDNLDEHQDFQAIDDKEKVVEFEINEDGVLNNDDCPMKTLIKEHFNARRMTYKVLKQRCIELGMNPAAIYNDIATLKKTASITSSKFMSFANILDIQLVAVPMSENYNKFELATLQLEKLLRQRPEMVDEVIERLKKIKGE